MIDPALTVGALRVLASGTAHGRLQRQLRHRLRAVCKDLCDAVDRSAQGLALVVCRAHRDLLRLPRFANLRVLRLRVYGHVGLQAALQHLPHQLEALALDDQDGTLTVPTMLPVLPFLQELLLLGFSTEGFEEELYERLAHMPLLHSLCLWSRDYLNVGSTVVRLQDLPNLANLDMDPLWNTAGLGALTTLTELTIAAPRDMNVHAVEAADLAQLSQLKRLEISSTPITVTDFSALPWLEVVVLCDCDVTDPDNMAAELMEANCTAFNITQGPPAEQSPYKLHAYLQIRRQVAEYKRWSHDDIYHTLLGGASVIVQAFEFEDSYVLDYERLDDA